jgi:hypothetical protein
MASMLRVNRSNLPLVGLFPLLLLAAPVQARLNLPQSKQVVTLPGNLVRSIRASLEPSPTAAVALPVPTQADLLSALPQDLRGACPSMIENWGEIAKGTAEGHARVLVRQADQVWLAFRCGSRAPEYEKDYDERPALMRLETGKLEFFPLGSDADNDSTLYHLEFSEFLPLEGAQGVAFKVTEPAGNPCCDGPESRSGESWRVFADSPHGVRELLSVTTARDDSSHCDEPEVDSETTYRAQIALDRDAQKLVREVAATFREEVKDITWDGAKANPHTVSERSGTLRYRWNPASLLFEEKK